MHDPEIVPLSEIGYPELRPLLEQSLGHRLAERTEAFWRWKHEANPFGPSPGLVAVAGGRPIALRVFLRWRFNCGDEMLEACRAVDTATHPEWRRRGLFRRLTLALVERVEADGTAFVFNTPNRRSRRGYLGMGWEDFGRPPLLVRPLHPLRAAAAFVDRRRRPGKPPGPGGAPPLHPIEALLDGPELPAFLARHQAERRRLHTVRDVRYLGWRYRPPGLRYGALWDLRGGSGAVVVARERARHGLLETTVTELLLSRDDFGREAAAGLIARIASSARADYLMAVATSRSSERAALVRSRFLPAPGLAPRLVVRRLRGGRQEPDPRRLEAWALSAGDLEVF